MEVTEIFSSIQGESTFAGLPCTFIRLTGCNLRCSYCDTSYAFEGGTNLEIDEIVRRVKDAGIFLTEITGGEPLLQEESYHLMKRLLNEGYNVLLETNGSLSLEAVDNRAIKILDLKCPGSGMCEHMDFSNMELLTNQDEVKFVIGDRMDFDWAREVICTYDLVKRCKVLISPQAQYLEARVAAEWILEEKLPVRLQLQLHKFIWPGVEKGV